MAEDRADRDLLFQALAVHLGFLARQTVRKLPVERPSQPTATGSLPLGERLVERAVLTPEQRAVIDAVADELLDRHKGDVRRCFDELCEFGTLRRELELQASPATATVTVKATPTRVHIRRWTRARSRPSATG